MVPVSQSRTPDHGAAARTAATTDTNSMRLIVSPSCDENADRLKQRVGKTLRSRRSGPLQVFMFLRGCFAASFAVFRHIAPLRVDYAPSESCKTFMAEHRNSCMLKQSRVLSDFTPSKVFAGLDVAVEAVSIVGSRAPWAPTRRSPWMKRSAASAARGSPAPSRRRLTDAEVWWWVGTSPGKGQEDRAERFPRAPLSRIRAGRPHQGSISPAVRCARRSFAWSAGAPMGRSVLAQERWQMQFTDHEPWRLPGWRHTRNWADRSGHRSRQDRIVPAMAVSGCSRHRPRYEASASRLRSGRRFSPGAFRRRQGSCCSCAGTEARL